MDSKSFFTRQRYIILGAGIILFIILLILANVFGHDSELGVLFIDLSGSAITIMATALVVEYFQYREQADRTKQVATIAEEEIQAISYRVKLAVVNLLGYTAATGDHEQAASLQDIDDYLQANSKRINEFYDAGAFKRITIDRLQNFQASTARLQTEIEHAITLFDYALPYTLRTNVLGLRSSLQISERTVNLLSDTQSLSSANTALVKELTAVIYDAAQAVLQHESRTTENQSIASKPGRASNDS